MAKTDFDVSKMPHNRVQVFFDVLKNRFSLLLGTGFAALLFALPLIVLAVLRNIKVAEAELIEDVAERAATVFAYVNTFNLTLIAAWAIFALGVAGAFQIVRRLVWQQGVLFRHDFFKGIRENGVHFAVLFAVAGLLNYLLQRTARGLYFNDGAWAQAALVAATVAAFLYLPTLPFALTQSTVYNLKMFAKWKNSFLLAMRTAYVSFPVAILNLAPIALTYLPGTAVFVASVLLGPVLFTPLLALFDTLFCDGVLDKYVNKKNFPEIVGKGIWKNAEDNDAKTE